MSDSINLLKQQADKSAEEFYKSSLELAQTKLDVAIDNMSAATANWQQEAIDEYTDVLKDCVVSFKTQIEEKQQELDTLTFQMKEMKNNVDCAVEAQRRAQELAEKENFYRLCLSEEDKQEIEKLRSILPYLREKEPLNKVIYKCYYEKPYTDMIGRVIGQKSPCGIYKITNMTNGMCYVGQSVNVSERFRQHIKRGLGAEQPTRNKLYPAMAEFGVENFTFELIEECDKSKLDEREDYWQNYFQAKEYGYSIT